MKRKTKYVIGTILGLILAVGGLFLMKQELDTINKAVPGIMIGIGSGVFGGSLGSFLGLIISKKYPEKAYQKEIEVKDERNIMIMNKAKSKAFSFIHYSFGPLLLIFVLMNVDLIIIILTVSAYLMLEGVMIFYMNKYSKEL